MECQVKPKMSNNGQDNQSTGLRDVFDILLKEPPERVLSVAVQLGETPQENIIHALCLFILKKEAQAVDKLQMMKDDNLAKHLAESWTASKGDLAEFGVHCGDFQGSTGDDLAALARIFKVLSERRLCDPLRRNLAYQRALSVEGQKTITCETLEYDRLREEAKDVCGPVLEEWMSSQRELSSGSCFDPHKSTDGMNTTLNETEQSGRDFSLASPLQASSAMPSYPTHLEISIPPTMPYQGDKIAPQTPDQAKNNSCVLHPLPSRSLEVHPLLEPKIDSKMDTVLGAESRKLDGRFVLNETANPTTKPSSEPKFDPSTPTNSFSPKVLVSTKLHESKDAEEEEEEEKFYAFVILHAHEDVDVAESMKVKMEAITGLEGATFSEDFAIPGRSTLRCVEDAINNSAFTFLLLTCNFNTRMVDMETDTALINSLNHKSKHNTVIPLLPRENSLPKKSLPMVLKTIVPLEENVNFEKRVLKVLSRRSYGRQQSIWKEGQRMKSQMERQDELKRLNQQQMELIQELKKADLLERETILMRQNLLLSPGALLGRGGGDGAAAMQQPPNIHIEHAQYIMIGNDSQMTVDHSGGADIDDSDFSEGKK